MTTCIWNQRQDEIRFRLSEEGRPWATRRGDEMIAPDVVDITRSVFISEDTSEKVEEWSVSFRGYVLKKDGSPRADGRRDYAPVHADPRDPRSETIAATEREWIERAKTELAKLDI